MIVPGSLAMFLHSSAGKAAWRTMIVMSSELMSELFAAQHAQHVLCVATVPDGSMIIRDAKLYPLSRDIRWLVIP